VTVTVNVVVLTFRLKMAVSAETSYED